MRGFGVYGDRGFVAGELVVGGRGRIGSEGFGVGAIDAEHMGAIVCEEEAGVRTWS